MPLYNPGGGGSGDVTGPATAVDSQVSVYDSTSGKIIKTAPIMITSGSEILSPAGTDLSFVAGDAAADSASIDYFGNWVDTGAGGDVRFWPGGNNGGADPLTDGHAYIYDPWSGGAAKFDTSTIDDTRNYDFVNNSGTLALINFGTALPISGANGEFFFDTDDSILYVWVDTAWVAISGGGGGGVGSTVFNWLTEDGSNILMEDGSVILMEIQ